MNLRRQRFCCVKVGGVTVTSPTAIPAHAPCPFLFSYSMLGMCGWGRSSAMVAVVLEKLQQNFFFPKLFPKCVTTVAHLRPRRDWSVAGRGVLGRPDSPRVPTFPTELFYQVRLPARGSPEFLSDCDGLKFRRRLFSLKRGKKNCFSLSTLISSGLILLP